MEKNDIFEFTAPNGAEVTAVVVLECPSYEDFEGRWNQYIIYAQNRLVFYNYNEDTHERRIGGILVDYAILPDYDKLLERYNDIEVARAETAMGM